MGILHHCTATGTRGENPPKGRGPFPPSAPSGSISLRETDDRRVERPRVPGDVRRPRRATEPIRLGADGRVSCRAIRPDPLPTCTAHIGGSSARGPIVTGSLVRPARERSGSAMEPGRDRRPAGGQRDAPRAEGFGWTGPDGLPRDPVGGRQRPKELESRFSTPTGPGPPPTGRPANRDQQVRLGGSPDSALSRRGDRDSNSAGSGLGTPSW